MYELITLAPNNRTPVLGPLGAYIYQEGKEDIDPDIIDQRKQNIAQRLDKKIQKKLTAGKDTTNLGNRKIRKLARLDRQLTEGNFFMRTGTPLAIYDSVKIEESRLNIKSYLNRKGFFDAEVTINVRERRKKVYQDFIVHEGERRFIDSLSYRTGDSLITHLLVENEAQSFLKEGDYYDRDNLTAERDRLTLLLKNSGYFAFNEGFVEFEVNFAPGNSDLIITVIINKPADKPFHTKYTLDSLIFNTTGPDAVMREVDLQGIHYMFGNTRYSERVLDTRLIARPLETYSYQRIVDTQRQLLSMDVFKFVNINFDTTMMAGKFIANVYTSPLQKFQLTQELGVNVTDGFPGPFYNIALRNRNTFNGLEIFQLNGFAGIEGISAAADDEDPYRSFQYGINSSLTFPRFLTPFNSRNLNLKTFNPRTVLSVGFALTDRPEYRRGTLNTTFGYLWQNLTGTKNYTLNVLDANLIDSNITDQAFEDQLDELAAQGNTLKLAFNRSFVSSSSINAVYNENYSNPNSPSSFLRWFAEAGGTTNDLWRNTEDTDNTDLEFYQFVKFQVDYRRYWPLKGNNSLVFRVNAGVANPYGDNNALPYEKFFFSGGSSSNRAWNPRRLGPGSSTPFLLDENGDNVLDGNGNPIPDRNNYQFEQPGEILLETSLEYRTKIGGFLDWAFFVDAGNIWRIDETTTSNTGGTVRISEGGDFKVNRFHKEIAVGAGMGMRLDFSFLVFRLDLGHKIRDPRFDIGSRWQRPFKRAGQTVWNIAVGYPF